MTTNQIILITGLPASGKTTLTKQISQEYDNSIIIDKDTINPYEKEIMRKATGHPNDRDSEYYRNNLYPYTIKALVNYSKMFHQNNHTVIIDAPFLALTKQALEENKTLAEILDKTYNIIPSEIIWCTVDELEQKQRMINRNAERDIPKLQDWENYTKLCNYYRNNIAHIRNKVNKTVEN